MNYNTLKRIVLNKQKGTFTSLLWEKQLPTRKAYNNMVVVKRTQGTVRLGIAYDNMQSVQTKRADGTLPQQNQGLQWGVWSMYPFFIEHKGNNYLRVALDKNNVLKTEYYINGIKSTKEQAEIYCTKSAFSNSSTKPDVLTINIDNILAIR